MWEGIFCKDKIKTACTVTDVRQYIAAQDLQPGVPIISMVTKIIKPQNQFLHEPVI